MAQGLGEVEALATAIRGLIGADTSPAASRLALLAQLDREVRGNLERVLVSPLVNDGHEAWRRVGAAAAAVFGALLDAYVGHLSSLDARPSAGGPPCGETATLLARAAADRLFWERVACADPHPDLWSSLGRVFVAATGQQGKVDWADTVIDEYLRAIAFHSAALDQLPVELVPAIRALIRFVSAAMQLQPGAVAAALYVVEPTERPVPQRLVRPLPSVEGAWFFSPARAEETLAALAERIANGAAPSTSPLASCPPERLLAAIGHLGRHWSASPLTRRYKRHVLQGRLSAVCGFDAFRSALDGRDGPGETAWSLRDISRGGVGAFVPSLAARELRIGALVGVRAEEGGVWHLGIVRRMRGVGEGGVVVGIETLSQRPVSIHVDDGRTPADVLACDPLLRGEAVRIAAPVRALRPDVPLFVSSNGTIQKLKPLDGSLSGCEFELRVYQVL